METDQDFIRWFSGIGIGEVAQVGGKNASLGEMFRALSASGVRVPNGFALSAAAYRETLRRAGTIERLRDLLGGLDANDEADLSRRARAARELVYQAPLPPEIAAQILEASHALRREYGDAMSFAVRSSATAEDLPEASFAGQHESFLNVSGDEGLLDAVRRCYASVFTERAIVYRIEHGFDDFAVALSVGIMKMVRSDLGSSGVAFTLDTETGFRDVVLITGAWGLGETVVQGSVDADEFHVHKPTFRAGRRAVLRRRLGEKQSCMVYADDAAQSRTRLIPTPPEQRERFCLDDAQVLELAGAAIAIEAHYSERAGQPVPMDVEWALDGVDGKLYIVQARPETVASRKPLHLLETWHVRPGQKPIVTGRAVGTKAAAGRARVISSLDELRDFIPGEVLVADTTTPDWGAVMRGAAAIVTNRGARTCHAAIVARELGIPAIVGCGNATAQIRNGDEITVSCAEGEAGRVYAGRVPFERQSIDLAQLAMPATRLMTNIGNPDLAFGCALLPNDGVGLARMEFIIAEHIRAHPMALLHPERVADAGERAELQRLARLDATPADYFVRQLSEGVGTIAAAFYPRPVIVRLSDFKTNEYASLLGGRWFEPQEANPMLGFRGAARYAHPAYAEGFALECRAMQRVRGEMGLSNVKLMIPFCRRVEEAERVLDAMARHGLARGQDGLEVYVMCEIPNNIILIDAFARLFDGFSIGSNDLTQLVLGVDRDSEIVAFDFDERDPGVTEMLRQAIVGAHRNGRHVGICGQAPSDYPEVARFLVQQGIDSISLNPDRLVSTARELEALERSLGRAQRPLTD